MNLSLQDLQAEAAATGFPMETLDKVIPIDDSEKVEIAAIHPDFAYRLGNERQRDDRAGEQIAANIVEPAVTQRNEHLFS